MTEHSTLRLAEPDIAVEERADGTILLRSRTALGSHPQRLGDVLTRSAERTPDTTFLAERRDDQWTRITYGTALERATAIARFLVGRGLDHSTPLAILSGNSIQHALVSLGATLVGVPVVPVSPAYSRGSGDHGRLRYVIDAVRPAMLFVEDAADCAGALDALDLRDRIVATGSEDPAPSHFVSFSELLGTHIADAQLHRRIEEVTPSHVARYMLTSGSTGTPKPVITTHGMLCANQQMIAQLWRFLEDTPPVVVDWLPWSHTYGGAKIFNLTMWHGGTFYIDGGKPVTGSLEITLRNLREISPTVTFNVPRGLALLVPHLETDSALRERFFARLQMICFAAAALPDDLWTRLRELSMTVRGGQPVFISSGFGSTETSPTSTLVHFPVSDPRIIGLPPPGVELKLAPAEGDKMEIRVRGPHVTPGYLHDPDATRAAFDDEGFLRMGDAVRMADPDLPECGLRFEGRLTENFKLSTGTWVNTGALRVDILAATAPLLADAVPTAPDHDYLGLLAWLNPSAADGAGDPEARADLAAKLQNFNREHPGASTTVKRVLLLSEPPSLEAGEITDKQYVNQRAVRDRRKAEVARIYLDPAPPDVIEIA